jgi:gluconolactonase
LSGTSQEIKQNQVITAKNAKVTKVGSGYNFTEGPAVAPDGRVFFTDQPNNKIFIWNEKNDIELFLEGTNRSNGLFFYKNKLVACADLYNQLVSFDENKKMEIIYEGYDGKPLNAPNDLWIAPNGGIYFSDPFYPRKYWTEGRIEMQDKRAVYYISAKGTATRVIDDFKQPNGLIGTPDGKILYVSDIKDSKIWKYDILSDGTLANKTLFVSEGADGMTIDNRGNVYLTNKFVSVFDQSGKKIAEIECPESPSNICFGGKKRNILFITARTSVYTLKMKVKGVN